LKKCLSLLIFNLCLVLTVHAQVPNTYRPPDSNNYQDPSSEYMKKFGEDEICHKEGLEVLNKCSPLESKTLEQCWKAKLSSSCENQLTSGGNRDSACLQELSNVNPECIPASKKATTDCMTASATPYCTRQAAIVHSNLQKHEEACAIERKKAMAELRDCTGNAKTPEETVACIRRQSGTLKCNQ